MYRIKITAVIHKGKRHSGKKCASFYFSLVYMQYKFNRIKFAAHDLIEVTSFCFSSLLN